MTVKTILTLTVLLFFSTLAIAKEKEIKKLNMAVFKIQANKCPQDLGTAIEEVLMTRIFSTKLFILMDKDMMNTIARKTVLCV